MGQTKRRPCHSNLLGSAESHIKQQMHLNFSNQNRLSGTQEALQRKIKAAWIFLTNVASLQPKYGHSQVRNVWNKNITHVPNIMESSKITPPSPLCIFFLVVFSFSFQVLCFSLISGLFFWLYFFSLILYFLSLIVFIQSSPSALPSIHLSAPPSSFCFVFSHFQGFSLNFISGFGGLAFTPFPSPLNMSEFDQLFTCC